MVKDVEFRYGHCFWLKYRKTKVMILITSINYLRERSHMTSAAEGGGGFEMLTVADKGGGGGGGLSLADVSKNTKILAKIVSNQACLTLCVRLLH